MHDHNHDHSHVHHHHDGNIGWAIVVNLVLTVAQIVGGVISGSVALIADAVHNLSDAVSLIVAFAARRIARRPATPEMSFGYGRAEVVAALVNYTTLVVIAVWLAAEAMGRLVDPPPVQGSIVIWLAGLALVIDLITAALTYRLAKESVNIRAAFLHNLADAGSSVAVILGGVLILAFNWHLADPLITLAISGWILWHALVEAAPVIRILMLASPPAADVTVLRSSILAVPGVEDLHHLHLWQIDERRNSLEAHLVLSDGADAAATVARVRETLAHDLGITHATLETETRASGCSAPACAA